MSRKRRVLGAAFKARVALAAVRGEKTTAQLAAEFEVHAGQATVWTKQLLEHVPELFEDGRRKPARVLIIRERTRELHHAASLIERTKLLGL